MQKQAKVGQDRVALKTVTISERLREVLIQGKSARTLVLTEDEEELIHDFFLLTRKPVVYVCNVDEASAAKGNSLTEAFRKSVADENAEILIIAAATEADIAELDNYEEKQLFLEDLGLDEPGVNKLIHAAYRLLNLQTYFTTGADESRAWTFVNGIKAPKAAGIIHSDFEKGFIRAEVIKYEDYVTLGSESACREVGKIAVEGKEYVVQDGDIMHFRFNV